MKVMVEDLAKDYAKQGYVAVPNLVDASLVARLLDETTAIVAGERGDIPGVVHGAEPEAALASVLAVHFPHKVSPLMLEMLSHPAIVEILTTLIGPDVKAMQSMLFIKNAGKPGQAWHQDEFYIATRDRSLTGVWIALEDATIDNGCLWMQPGSHKPGILYPMGKHNDPRFDGNDEICEMPYERDSGVPIEVKAGGVVFFNGYVLHRSLNNTTSGARRALVNHYMNARSLLPWSHGNPPVPREDLRDFVMVSGEDPYAWRGFEDVTQPFIRPEKA
jgi:phytanoyl-CoA hydroxylase